MSYLSKAPSSTQECTYIRVPSPVYRCGGKFAIRSRDSTLDRKRLSFKCDVCDTFRWCKDSVEQVRVFEQEGHVRGNNNHEAQSMGNRDIEKNMQGELKQPKIKLNKQKLVRLVIKLGLVIFILVFFLILK